MIPGKINTHLFQNLTVLAKANQKGSFVYISPDKKIHSGTVFQKLSTFISRNWKDKSSVSNELKANHNIAKESVIENLKDQIKIYFYANNIPIDKDLESYISKFSECLVDRITNPDSSISIEKDFLTQFKKEFNPITSTNEKINLSDQNKQEVEMALKDVQFFSELSVENKSKFKFLALQFNEILRKDQSIAQSTDHKNKDPILEAQSTSSEKIDLIAENAVWIKKNKWIDSKRALSLAKEMARDELLDLTNNEKFNVLQKTLKSFKGKDKDFYDENFSTSLANSVQRIQNKKIAKELKIDEKLAEFKKTLTYKEKKSINDEIMKEVLISNHNLELSNKEIFTKYAWTLLEKKHNPIAK
jgi:hypothetical protein